VAISERKPFLLRIDSDLHTALARWADEELRSLNGQIEFLLNSILMEAGRLPTSRSSRALVPRPAARTPSSPRAQGRLSSSPGRQPEHASGVRRRKPPSLRAMAPRPAARKPSDTRTQVRLPTPPGRQPEHASGVQRQEPVSPQTPTPPLAARKPADEGPPPRRPNDDWDAMVD
jgi:hypothetical protein